MAPKSAGATSTAVRPKNRASASDVATSFYIYDYGVVDGEDTLAHSTSLWNLQRPRELHPASFRTVVEKWHKEAPPAPRASATAAASPPGKAVYTTAPSRCAVESVYRLCSYADLVPHREASAESIARTPESPPMRSRPPPSASHYTLGGYLHGYSFGFLATPERGISARAVEDLYNGSDGPAYSRLLFEGDFTLPPASDCESLDDRAAPSVFCRAVFAPVSESVAADPCRNNAEDETRTEYSELSRRQTFGVLMPAGHSQVVGQAWEEATWIGPTSPDDSFDAASFYHGWDAQTAVSAARTAGRSVCPGMEDWEDVDVDVPQCTEPKKSAENPRRTPAAAPRCGSPGHFNRPAEDFPASQRVADGPRHCPPVFVKSEVSPAVSSPQSRAPRPWPPCLAEGVTLRTGLPRRPPNSKPFFMNALDDARPVRSPDWNALSHRDKAQAALSLTPSPPPPAQQQRLAISRQLHSPCKARAR